MRTARKQYDVQFVPCNHKVRVFLDQDAQNTVARRTTCSKCKQEARDIRFIPTDTVRHMPLQEQRQFLAIEAIVLMVFARTVYKTTTNIFRFALVAPGETESLEACIGVHAFSVIFMALLANLYLWMRRPPGH